MESLMSATLALDLSILKPIALFVFLGIFLAIVIKLLLTRRSAYEKRRRLPLDDDRVLEPRDDGDASSTRRTDEDQVRHGSQ
jgi:cbb3-type cytochrome oxidase subunit 3